MSLSDADFAAEAEAAMGGFLGKIGLLAPRSTYPLGSIMPRASPITGWRWLETPPTACTDRRPGGQCRLPRCGALAQVLVEGARLGLDLGDHQLMTRYQRWRASTHSWSAWRPTA